MTAVLDFDTEFKELIGRVKFSGSAVRDAYATAKSISASLGQSDLVTGATSANLDVSAILVIVDGSIGLDVCVYGRNELPTFVDFDVRLIWAGGRSCLGRQHLWDSSGYFLEFPVGQVQNLVGACLEPVSIKLLS